MSALRVEFFFDEEASSWHFRVPALHINGVGRRPGRGSRRQVGAVAGGTRLSPGAGRLFEQRFA